MSQTVHVFEYLQSPAKFPPAAVNVLFGDEPFLKRMALDALCTAVVGDDDDSPYATFDGRSTEWRDVMDEVATVSLFGSSGRRLAVVDEADDFVSRHRQQLEEHVAKAKSSGVLVLSVSSWQKNTRLYKEVDKRGLQVECRPPEKKGGKSLDEARLAKWLVARAKSPHQAKLDSTAAQLMVDLVGPHFGLLEQELAKLALFADIGGTITPEMVGEVVGGWRTKTTWQLIDAAAEGKTADALAQLDRLLQSGEAPLALFGQISWSLRRFAAATRIFEAAERQGRRISLRDALKQAGVREWPRDALANAERQLIQMGRHRAGKLYRWLLETDLALKGTHSHGERARFALEMLFTKLNKEAR